MKNSTTEKIIKFIDAIWFILISFILLFFAVCFYWLFGEYVEIYGHAKMRSVPLRPW